MPGAEILVMGLAAALALAQQEERPPEDSGAPETQAIVESQSEADVAKKVADALSGDSSMRSSLAARILRSQISAQIAGGEADPQAAVESWIQSNPKDAAHLAIGFAQDDESGTQEFEKSLTERVKRYLRLNPDREGGLLGVLKAAGGESKVIRKLGKKMDEEEQRELVKRLFEGQGGAQGRVLKQPGDDQGGGKPDPANPDSVVGSSAYDRLSALNPSGYSPDVLSLQSALNAQRPPGAPKLVETGRLDFPTLVHPIYALRADLGRQEAGLRARRAAALAQALGRSGEFKASDFADAGVQAKLEREGAGRPLPPRVARRRQALDRAKASSEEFRAAAERMQSPSSITRAGLRELSAKQKEASRWLLVATLEADLERLEAEGAFWTPELESLIRTAPATETARQAFLARGKATVARLTRIRDHDETAMRLLLAPDYAARWPAVERELASGNALRRGLSRDLTLVARVPAGLHSASRPPAGWRALAERWVRRLAPSSRWAKDAESREQRAGAWSEAFSLVAAGDFARAQRAAESAGR